MICSLSRFFNLSRSVRFKFCSNHPLQDHSSLVSAKPNTKGVEEILWNCSFLLEGKLAKELFQVIGRSICLNTIKINLYGILQKNILQILNDGTANRNKYFFCVWKYHLNIFPTILRYHSQFFYRIRASKEVKIVYSNLITLNCHK